MCNILYIPFRFGIGITDAMLEHIPDDDNNPPMNDARIVPSEVVIDDMFAAIRENAVAIADTVSIVDSSILVSFVCSRGSSHIILQPVS